MKAPGVAQMPAIGSAVVPASRAISRRKWVKPCCTVPGRGRHSAAVGASAIASPADHGVGAPCGRRQLDHAAEQARLRGGAAAAPRRRRGRARTRRRDAAAAPAFRPGPGGFRQFPVAAAAQSLPPRAQHAARPARRADDGAEIHQRLGEIAGARIGHQRRGERLEARLGRGERRALGEEPGYHALDIAVDRRDPAVERDRRDRGRGVVADPGQGRAAAAGRRGNARHGVRRWRGRRNAGCGRARNSRAPATDAAPRRARPRPMHECRASVPRIGQNRGRPSPPWFAAA